MEVSVNVQGGCFDISVFRKCDFLGEYVPQLARSIILGKLEAYPLRGSGRGGGVPSVLEVPDYISLGQRMLSTKKN